MNKRQAKLLNRLKRDGLGISEGIRQVAYDDVTAKASERGTTDLLKQGLIAAHQLIAAKKYYTLTQRGAQAIDYTDRRAGEPFVAQGLLTNYTIMRFCLAGQFERMTRPEFCERFPMLVGPRVLSGAFRTRYFLDHTGASKKRGVVRLGLMVCDLGSRSRRILRKVRREHQKRTECSLDWKKLIDSQLFSICVLTFSKAKAERLEALLENEKFHVRVAVVPGLAELLFGRPAR